mgnify:FL=1
MIKNIKKKLVAFTLAETLIVMGIIGVVAALTIPNLNSSTADKEKVAKVKKLYSNMNDALGRAEAVYGPIAEWFKNDGTSTSAMSNRFGERMTEFLKVSKNCAIKTDQGCFSNGAKNIKMRSNEELNDQYDKSSDYYKVQLADGTSVAFRMDLPRGTEAYFGQIYVNLDGPNKGARKVNKNIFGFIINNGELQPSGANQADNVCFTDLGNLNPYCTKWVIENDNLDYLKADASGKCPNGKVLNWTTNTTCK